ncbi:MAG TPA: AAA family ATPase [Candidatus Saccharimonadaceae bacterium]|nr:AAA family ATPase [Candidatus Saccharimonadaceae bacterium]
MPATSLMKRYRLDAPIGRGATGVVYRAHDAVLDRRVAVKVLDGPLDAEARERVAREARVSASLNHPHVVAIYDSGEDDGQVFLVMELVDGPSLRDAKGLSVAEIVDIACQLCDALAHAHAHGIVHRDLKPENVLLAPGSDGPDAKLADLGLARSRRATRITSEGAVLGTALYLAPEQALSLDVDGRADLYALGALLYEQLTGRPPFDGDDPLAIISQHLHAPVVPPRALKPDLPPALDAIVVRLLAKNPDDRFPDAAAAGAALAAAPLDPATETPADEGTDRVALLDQLARGRLVGRRGELQQLRELWQRARRGQGHLALVSGEPGVGKTRLANEAIVFAQLNGATILKGGSYEYEATTPYLPFIEALRSWVRAADVATLRARLGDSAADLARFAPEIEARLGTLEPDPPLPPNEERLRLFDHVARFFRALAQDDGLLLFLDDLHWADHGSLALLHYLMRNLKDARWLVLATYREVELGRDHPLAASLVEWNRERLATRVSLGRFGASETGALLATMFGQETVTADFAAAVHRETEGNPFFIEEVVKALIERGQIFRDREGWQRESVKALIIPQSIKAAVGRRLERLSEPCTEVLHAAAALGKQFGFAELASAVALDEGALLDALDEAGGAQLVRATSGESFAFTHDKIREVLYEELNPIRRRRLHQRIGQALEKLYATALDVHSPDLAYHYVEAGDLEKGFAYSLQAADRSLAVFATGEALTHTLRARECVEAHGDAARLAEMDRRLGNLYGLRGELAPAVAVYTRLLAAASGTRERAAVKVLLAEIHARNGEPRGMTLLEEALADLDPVTQAVDRANALTMVGRYHHYRMEHRRSIEYFEQALAVLEPMDRLEDLAQLYSYFAGAYQHLALFDESMAWARRALVLGEQRNNPVLMGIGHEFLAEDNSATGRWKETREHSLKNREIGERLGSLERQAWSSFPLALAAYATGDLEGALREVEYGVVRFAQGGDVRGSIFPRVVRVRVLCDLGRIDEARPEAEQVHADAERLGQPLLRTLGRQALAYVHLADGDAAGAAALGADCESWYAGTDNRIGLTVLAPWYAMVCLAAGQLDEVARVCAFAIPLCREVGAQESLVRLSSVQAALSATRREDEAAAREFAAALAFAEKLEMRPEQGHIFGARAAWHRACGDAAAAVADENKAIELFEACGMKPAAAKLREGAKRRPATPSV